MEPIIGLSPEATGLDAEIHDDGEGLPPYDALDLVLHEDALMTVFAAQRLHRIDVYRVEALRAASATTSALRPQREILERGVRLELAASLRTTEYAAGRLLGLAEAVVHRYPRILDSLLGARMTQAHAEVLVDALDALPPEQRADAVAPGVALAEAEPLGVFRRRLRLMVDRLRAVTLEKRHAQALQARRVVVEQVEDGMAWLHALIPAVEARAIESRLTGMATMMGAAEGETRSRDQLRSDVLCDLLIDGRVGAHPDAARGVRATVVVTVPAFSLLAGDEAPGGEPPTIEGVGPIPLARARELCGGGGEWMRILTHPETGIVVSAGRERYRPPPELRRLVRWRAERCMAPGCGIPASRCEIDHTIAWEHGGSTDLRNLAPLCKGHHTVKHHGGWRVQQIEDSGAMEWRSPLGRTYVVEPERRIPVFVPEGPAPF